MRRAAIYLVIIKSICSYVLKSWHENISRLVWCMASCSNSMFWKGFALSSCCYANVEWVFYFSGSWCLDSIKQALIFLYAVQWYCQISKRSCDEDIGLNTRHFWSTFSENQILLCLRKETGYAIKLKTGNFSYGLDIEFRIVAAKNWIFLLLGMCSIKVTCGSRG